MDRRILKNPLSGFDTDETKMCLYLSKKGYFGSYVDDFEDVRQLTFGTLKCVEDGLFSPDEDEFYSFFLPEDYVSPEPSEEYRPYTLSEWIEQHEIGDIIHYRSKSDGTELLHMYLGTRHTQESVKITLGDSSYSLECLFEDYEIEVNGEWLPFGVKDE